MLLTNASRREIAYAPSLPESMSENSMNHHLHFEFESRTTKGGGGMRGKTLAIEKNERHSSINFVGMSIFPQIEVCVERNRSVSFVMVIEFYFHINIDVLEFII